MQHDAIVGFVEAVGRANRHTRGIITVHTGNGNGHFIRFAVVQSHYSAALDAPLDVVGVLTGGDAAVALDAALGVTHEFHLSHGVLLLPMRTLPHRPAIWSGRALSIKRAQYDKWCTWSLASVSPGRSRKWSPCWLPRPEHRAPCLPGSDHAGSRPGRCRQSGTA